MRACIFRVCVSFLCCSLLVRASPPVLSLACPSLPSARLPELNNHTAVSLKARPLCQSRTPVFVSAQQSGLVFPVVFLAFSRSSCRHPESHVAALFFKWTLLCVFIMRDVLLILISVALFLSAMSVQEKECREFFLAFYFQSDRAGSHYENRADSTACKCFCNVLDSNLTCDSESASDVQNWSLLRQKVNTGVMTLSHMHIAPRC